MPHKQPVYLNLLRIHLPIPGLVSILHRISGVVLTLAIPYLIYLLERSLQSEAEFERVRMHLKHPLAMGVTALLIISFMHHLLAGVRFLLMDMDIGHDLKSARASAWFTLFATPLLTLLVLALWWL